MSGLNWADVTDDTPVSALSANKGKKETLAAVARTGNTPIIAAAPSPPESQLTPKAEVLQTPVKNATAAPSRPPIKHAADAQQQPAAASSQDSTADQSDASTSQLASALAATNTIATSADEEAPLPIETLTGLHPNDNTAQVQITGGDDTSSIDSNNATSSIYKAASTFEDLHLTKPLLDAVYALKYTQPSKIQAQAIPIVLSAAHPNIIGQAHHGSGKTATFSLCILMRVDASRNTPQAVVVVPTRELALQVTSVIEQLAQFMPAIKVLCCVPTHSDVRTSDRGRIVQQIVVGTPGTIENRLKHRDLDARSVVMFIADEADQMVATAGHGEATMRIRRRFPVGQTQILLFSATFDRQVREFARQMAEKALEIEVKTEELSLDAIKQFYIECSSLEDKYTTLTSIYGLCEIGQSIIFVHTVATAKQLSNKMREDGYTVSLLHGRDMAPEQRDAVMTDFKKGATTVLITTNVLARGIDVLSVTLVINFDIPLDRYGKPDPETYIHRSVASER